MPIELPAWKAGSVCGCFIDLDAKEIIFSLNGVAAPVVLKDIFNDLSPGFFPAASFMSFQQCRFNFGSVPFKYPPNRPFSIFNEFGRLSPEDKVSWPTLEQIVVAFKISIFQIVLPRHLFLEELRKLSVTEDACTLCFDALAEIKLLPCQHTGFCKQCADQLSICPQCRGPIDTRELELKNIDVVVKDISNAETDKS